MLYNLCQGLSSCVYQSLSDIDHFDCATASSGSGVLTYRTRTHTQPVEKVFVVARKGSHEKSSRKNKN